MWISKNEWHNLYYELDAKRMQCSYYKERIEYYQKNFYRYKELYLEELQKRIELTEKVRKMEDD